MRFCGTIAAAIAVAGACFAGLAPAVAQEVGAAPTTRSQIFDLRLDASYTEQPQDFREYACGTNGGPPGVGIKGFAEFAKCPAEPTTGLHEVQFRYNDEIEYWALAMELQPIAERFGGTRVATFYVIVSALFDDAGILRGYRAMTDDRVPLRDRRVAYNMALYLKQHFKDFATFECTDLPAAEGETGVGLNFVKQDCIGTGAGGERLFLDSRLLHRKGQTAIDPHSGEIRASLYVSTTRLDVYAAGYGPS